jgi:hypothetical protein
LAHELETAPLRTLGRFVAIFAALSLLWSLLVPLYASLLTAIASVVAPVVERSPDARWVTDFAKVVVVRSIPNPAGGAWRLRQSVWDGNVTFTPALLAAALLATPAWNGARRRRVLALGLGALASTHLANVLVNTVYTQVRPLVHAGVVVQQGGSFGAQMVLNALSYFFDTMGGLFFTIAIYAWLVATRWRAPAPPRHANERRAKRRAGRRRGEQPKRGRL